MFALGSLRLNSIHMAKNNPAIQVSALRGVFTRVWCLRLFAVFNTCACLGLSFRVRPIAEQSLSGWSTGSPGREEIDCIWRAACCSVIKDEMEDEMSSSKTSAGNEAEPEEITSHRKQNRKSKQRGFGWRDFFLKYVVMCQRMQSYLPFSRGNVCSSCCSAAAGGCWILSVRFCEGRAFLCLRAPHAVLSTGGRQKEECCR